MREWQHFRARAELCLEMARQMSDRSIARDLRAAAERLKEEADLMEKHDSPPSRQPGRQEG